MSNDVLSRSVIGILIVNYGKARRLKSGLESISRQDYDGELPTIVLNNSPSENEHSIIRCAEEDNHSVRVLENSENIGYSRGINVAFEALPACDYILLMSPDIIVEEPSVLRRLVEQMDANPNVGVLAATQTNDDGSIVEVARRFPSLGKQIVRRLSRGRFYQDIELLPSRGNNKVMIVDWVQSSFCLIRTDLWKQPSGFDERFFVFMADTDLSRRSKRLGWETAVTSISGVRADGVRASSGGIISTLRSRTMKIHVADALRYHFGRSG